MKNGNRIVRLKYYQGLSFAIQADIFTSLESIWHAFRQVQNREMSKNVSQYFETRHLITYLLSNSKILEFKSNRKILRFAKNEKIYINYSNEDIFLEGRG